MKKNFKHSNYGDLFVEPIVSEFNLETFKSKKCQKHEMIVEDGNHNDYPDSKTELFSFLEELSRTEAKYPDGTEAEYIISFMSRLGENVCKELQYKHEMFENCHLLKTGSIFEGLKVDGPDEFDFMIILPYFADEQNAIFQADDYVEFLKWTFVDVDEEKKESKNKYFFNIDEVLDEIIASLLPPNKWKISNKFAGTFGGILNIAHTRTLKYRGEAYPDLEIDVDFCFAVPLNKVTVWKGGLISPKFPMTPSLCKTKQKVFYILFNEKCRISFSYYEKKIVNEFQLNSKPKTLLRLLKVLRSKYISKVFDDNSRIMSSLVSTYLLKTLIYYAINATPCALCWEERRLDELLLEQLLKLKSSVIKRELKSFFVPKYNLLLKLGGLRKTTFCSMSIDRAKSKEKREQLLKDLDNLILQLTSLQDGDTRAYNVLKEIEARFTMENEISLKNGFKDELLAQLYYYAYNGADDEGGLNTMKSFVNECLPNMEILGEGFDLVLKEHGNIIDIDNWLCKVYETDDDEKPFNYYPLSKRANK